MPRNALLCLAALALGILPAAARGAPASAAPQSPAKSGPRAQLFGMRGYPREADSWDASRSFFPFIDAFGQYAHRQWPGKVLSPADLASRRQAELKDLDAHRGPADWNRYGGWAGGPALRATGFFRAEKHAGRWWLVDPEGRLFFSHGIDCVRTGDATPIDDRDAWFEDFPGRRPEFQEFLATAGHVVRDYYAGKRPRTFNFYGANLLRKYGPEWRKEFAEISHRRLRSWGLNTIGNWSDPKVYALRRTPYVVTINYTSRPLEGSTGYWGKFKDPFDPGFEAALRRRMQAERGTSAGDPWCVGYFVDNELSWGGETALAEAALRSPADQAAKHAFLDFLKQKYGPVAKLNEAWGAAHGSWEALLAHQDAPDAKRAAADLTAFTTRIAVQYFTTVRKVVKEVAPDQLYLGCRFAWQNPRAVAAAGESCDVVSFNLYRRSVADFRLSGGLDRPVLIGEFHFGALDRGMFHTGLVPVKDQKERGEAYRAYVRGAAENPQIVGCHWFLYADQPTTGRALDGENYQIGFVDICDTPYPETIAACREAGYSLYGK